MAAASSKEREAGFGASFASAARANSAVAPSVMPKTSSPGRNLVTSAPTLSTMPATSKPGTPYAGRSRPVAIRIATGDPWTANTSPMWTAAARTRIRTSPAPIAGISISLACRPSMDP